MQKTDIFFAHPDPQEAERLCRHAGNEAGLTVAFSSTLAGASAFLENKENSPGIALIAPFPPVEHSTEYSLLKSATSRQIPTIALLNGSVRESAVPASVRNQPSFIGVYDITRGPEPLTAKIHRLWQNRRLKTLLLADSPDIQREIHLELQRCLFRVHSTQNARSIRTILEKNPDVALLVLHAGTEPQPLLRVLEEVRSRFSRTELGIVALTGKCLAHLVPDIVDSGADACLSLPIPHAELRAICMNRAAAVEHIRALSGRNVRKSRVITAMAENLRAYINNARDTAQNLLDSLPAPGAAASPISPEQRSAVSSISRGATDALALLNDFTDLDDLDRNALQLDIRPDRLDVLVAERLSQATQTMWGKSLRIRRILTEVTCPMDRPRMGQLVDRLIAGAIKNTPSGKDVVIRVGQTENEAVLTISNQGPGIPPEDRPHLFKFPAAGPMPGSSRLGLFLAAQLVAAHNGRIWMESKLDQETIFFVALPLNLGTCASADPINTDA